MINLWIEFTLTHYETYDRTKNSFHLQIYLKKNAFILIHINSYLNIKIRVCYLFNISIINFLFKIYLYLQFLIFSSMLYTYFYYLYHYIKFFLLRHETKKIEESLIDGIREIK